MGLPGAVDGPRLPGPRARSVVEGLFAGLTVADIHGDAHRNIVSLRESQDLYDDLTPNPQSWQAAIDLELATTPPTYRSPRPIIDRPFAEAVFNEAIRIPNEHR